MAQQTQQMELRIDINAQTPTTTATKKTLADIIAFPAQLASQVLIKFALVSWGFNQIRQAAEYFYGWWLERQREMREEMARLKTELQGLTPSSKPGEVKLLPSMRRYVGLAESIGPGVKATDLTALDKVLRDAFAEGTYRENLLPAAARAKYAGGGEASDVETVGALRAIMFGGRMGEDRASATLTALQSTMPGGTAELFRAWARNVGRSTGGMQPGDIAPFMYMLTLGTAAANKELRGAQATTSFLTNMRQRMRDVGRQRGVERYLGDLWTDEGELRDIEALQSALTGVKGRDVRLFNRLSQDLVSNNLAQQQLDLLVGTGFEQGTDVNAALRQARNVTRVIRNPWMAYGIQAQKLQTARELMPEAEAAAAREQITRLKQPPEEWLRQSMIEMAEGIDRDLKARGHSWWSRYYTTGDIRSIVNRTLKSTAGLDPREQAMAVVADVTNFMIPREDSVDARGRPYKRAMEDLNELAAPYYERIGTYEDLIREYRGLPPRQVVNVNYVAADRAYRAISRLPGLPGLNIGAVLDLARAAVDLLPMH